MSKLKDEVGNRYGRLVVLGRAESRDGKVLWKCVCDCGKECLVMGVLLRSGGTRSCGCLQIENRITHGLTKAPLYRLWGCIRSRCSNENNKQFKDYGGRGITVCKEWEDSTVFFEWAKNNGYKKGLQIDRIDNDGGYSPDNCRFVKVIENIHNRRDVRSTNKTGYTGVIPNRRRFLAFVRSNSIGKRGVYLGSFKTKKEALEARNNFILENNLPHKIQDYRGEDYSVDLAMERHMEIVKKNKIKAYNGE